MKLWNDLCDWAATNAAAPRLCFRMTVAGILAYVLAELFALPQDIGRYFQQSLSCKPALAARLKRPSTA